MRVVLIDDEPIALDLLEQMLSDKDGIHIVGRYTNPHQALKELNELRPDVVFLDIKMGDVSGIKLGDSLLEKNSDLEIVFVTAYSEYAVDAFEMHAIDYLLKPVYEKRLDKTIERLRKRLASDSRNGQNSEEVGLKISCFGGFKVSDKQGRPFLWRTKKTKELFAYLWTRPKQYADKTAIIEDVFFDKNYEQATTILHTTVYQLRNNLKRLGHLNGILYFNEGYQLNLSVEKDFDVLDELLQKKGRAGRTDKDLEDILSIYSGDFMEEGYLWAIEAQQSYRNSVYAALKDFSDSQLKRLRGEGGGYYGELLKNCLYMMYKIDPYNEDTANGIIQYYGEQKQRIELESFYACYTANLRTEMNIGPTEKTGQLYNRTIKSIETGKFI